jgi:ATP-dependent protease Clp ATPase subunit
MGGPVLRGQKMRVTTRLVLLIAGPGVRICDECVYLCNEIFAEERDEPGASH